MNSKLGRNLEDRRRSLMHISHRHLSGGIEGNSENQKSKIADVSVNK